MGNFSIVSRESHNFAKTIKEATFIRVNDPFLNTDIRKYELSHIWDEVLSTDPDLNIK